MEYRVFDSNHTKVQIAQIHDANWPLLAKGDKIPLTVNNKDSLYIVTDIGGLNIDNNNKVVVDIWVNDFFAKAK